MSHFSLGCQETTGMHHWLLIMTDCEYDGQYEEKKCRRQIKLQATTCNGNTSVSFHYGPSRSMSHDILTQHDMIVWSIGRHPYDGNYTARVGVNDAFALYNHIFQPSCEALNATELCKKVVWLDSHFRLNAKYDDENFDMALTFHIESPTWIFRGCGVRRIASVWDATENLVTYFPSDAENMTFDGMHYGRAINLLKAKASYQAWATELPHC
jgi:hypothetical protein